jgi:Transcription factor WhiB
VTATWEGLLDALGGAPRLDGALCRGRAGLFDATDDDQAAEAIAICHECPALQRCREWADAQPINSLSGVVAGQVFVWVSHPSLRRQAKTA